MTTHTQAPCVVTSRHGDHVAAARADVHGGLAVRDAEGDDAAGVAPQQRQAQAAQEGEAVVDGVCVGG